MFFTYTEFNELKVNNCPISDELFPKAGSDTEITEHAKRHRKNKIDLSLNDEDYEVILAALAGGTIGVLTAMGLMTSTKNIQPVVPTVNNLEITYVENTVDLSFSLANISQGTALLSVNDKETEEVVFKKENLINMTYHCVFMVEYNTEYIATISNINGDSVTVIKSFDLIARK